MTAAGAHVFVTSDLGCEVGLTSLARFLAPRGKVACVNVPMASIRNPETLHHMIPGDWPKASITLFGDFWSPDAILLLKTGNLLPPVVNYRFDGTVWTFNDAKGEWSERASSGSTVSPTAFVIERVVGFAGESPSLRFAVSQTARCSPFSTTAAGA